MLYRLVASSLSFQGQASRVQYSSWNNLDFLGPRDPFSPIHIKKWLLWNSGREKAFGNSSDFRFALSNFTVSTAMDWYISTLSGSCTKPDKSR